MGKKIFISYASETDAEVTILAEHLKSGGHDVWRDSRVLIGQAWWDEILSAIRDRDLFVFAVSNAALESTACTLEFEYARRLDRDDCADYRCWLA